MPLVLSSTITKLRLMKTLVWPVMTWMCNVQHRHWRRKRRGAFGLWEQVHLNVAENSVNEATDNWTSPQDGWNESGGWRVHKGSL